MPLVLRDEKGSALTYEELDGNFTHLSASINISYNNTTSGLTSTSVQTAIDELTLNVGTGVTAAIVESAPPGSVMFYMSSIAPTGWLKANGANISRTVYANLWAALGFPNTGDGSTTFTLPDLRGEFLRCWDDGRGLDPGRVMFSAQGDAIRNVTGFVETSHSLHLNLSSGYSGPFTARGGPGQSRGGTEGGNQYYRGFDFNLGLVVPTAAENRPRNYALLACVKY